MEKIYFTRKETTIIKKRNLYELLGVPRDASCSTIDKMYNVHKNAINPDRLNHPVVINFLEDISKARAVLMDPDLRKKYDMDLAVSDGISNYLKSSLDDVSFVRKEYEISRSENLMDDDEKPAFSGGIIEDSDQFYFHGRPYPKNVDDAIALPNLAPVEIQRRLQYVWVILFISMFVPDIFSHCLYNWDTIKLPKRPRFSGNIWDPP